MNLPVDKQKQRLEALEDSEEALEKEILKVSQSDYIGHIEKLHDQLIKAWDTEERVKTLKIAIQVAFSSLSGLSLCSSFCFCFFLYSVPRFFPILVL